MEKLKELLETLTAKTPEKEIVETFEKIAKMLITSCQIKSATGNEYGIEEIEFYIRNKNHNDTSTHMHNCDVAKWRTHYSGIDITFGSAFEDKQMPKTPPKNCGENTVYGGILIRSISLKQEDKVHYINGPLRVLTTLLTGNDIEKGGFALTLVNNSIRSCIIETTSRCGVNNPIDFKDKEYCFYNANTCKDWLPQYLKDKNNVNRIPKK